MALSDCPDCWDTPCSCSREYLGSKIHAFSELNKKFKSVVDELDKWKKHCEFLAQALEDIECCHSHLTAEAAVAMDANDKHREFLEKIG